MAEVANRHVVVGLARARQSWFTDLARWSSGAVAPFDFVKCLTAEEARAVLTVGRPASLLLVDSGMSRWDRDLIDAARHAGTPTVLVESGRASRDWEAIGCVDAVPERFGPEELLELLRRHSPSPERRTSGSRRIDLSGPDVEGRLVAVTGTGGSGASTVAVLAAQGLAAEAAGASREHSAASRQVPSTVLVDGARRASLALYHDVGDVIPGLPELVELNRQDRPDPDQIRDLAFEIPDRGYQLILGQRNPRDWTIMRPRVVEATLDALRRTYAHVVVDLDPDLEGEAETGSVDIEDRHSLSRTAVRAADSILVVAVAGLHGMHRIVALLDECIHCGADPRRLVPVITRAPRSPVDRAELTRALRELTSERRRQGTDISPPVFVNRIRGVEDLHRRVRPLPAGLAARLARAAAATAERIGPDRALDMPAPVRPGELGASFDARPERDEVA